MLMKANNNIRNRITKTIKNTNLAWLILPLIFLLVLFYAWGMLAVPFHPDESTQIYMSQDFTHFFTDPFSISYNPDQPLSAEGRYRAIDAPLTRYMIGFSRFLFKVPKLASDWDWEMGWFDNQQSGSYPTKEQLLVSRLAATLFLPISLILFFFSIRKIFSIPLALTVVTYLGLHPLILLHTRRAMAESFLVFGVTLFLWAITREKVHPWLVGITIAIAVCAKQSAAALVPVGIIAVCLIPIEGRYLRNMLSRLIECLVVFFTFWFILNPFFWKYPIPAAQLSINLRQILLNQQVNTHLVVNNMSLLERLYFSISNLFILPPSPFEVTSYLQATKDVILKYNSYPLHVWGRGIIAGSFLLTLNLGGIFIAIRTFPGYSRYKKRVIGLFALTFLFLLALEILLIPIPWQRYSTSLIPFVVFWSGFGLLPLFQYISESYMKHKAG